MADAHQPLGQYMQQEAPDKLLNGQVHHLPAVVVSVILVAQGHLILLQAQESAVADGGAMGITGQIVDDVLARLQTGLGVDHPLLRHQPIQEGVDLAGAGHPRELSGLGTGP